MPLLIEAEPAPLESSADGVIRIRGSRVTLDTVVEAFKVGATAEEIAQQYPSIEIAEVYATIAYYLRHLADVETYLNQRYAEQNRVRLESEARFSPIGIRERLLARQTGRSTESDATSGN